MHCLKGSSCLVNARCDLKENNDKNREYYQMTWRDLVLETRPEQKISLSESNILQKESYEQRQVAHFLVRRCPDLRIQLGRQGEELQDYQLPYKNILPVPIFTPCRAASLRDSRCEPAPAAVASVLELEKAPLSGVCVEKREVSQITKDMPKVVQPSRVQFRASSLISPPGESPHVVQRR